MTDRISRRFKRRVADRAMQRCEYCGTPSRYCPDPLSVEHIVPRSKGGASNDSNLCLACQGCNNHKYVTTEAVDPVTGDTVPLYQPRQHDWHDHFCWSADLSLILGTTPTGRATVKKLRLNRPGVVGLRAALAATGLHPASKA